MRCTGRCEYCAGKRLGAYEGETILPCKDCLPGVVCTCCVTKASCLNPSVFKNYKKKPANPEWDVEPGNSDILKKTKP
jgi:hypothetical protein